jgi:hypothetical protein
MPSKTVKPNRQEQSKQFDAVYARLCKLLGKHKDKLSVGIEKPGTVWMSVNGETYRGKPLYYAGVRMGKNYVSYHLVTVYMDKVKMSPELKKRMQGKGCFNFASIDERLFGELDKLTTEGLKNYSGKMLEKKMDARKKK